MATAKRELLKPVNPKKKEVSLSEPIRVRELALVKNKDAYTRNKARPGNAELLGEERYAVDFPRYLSNLPPSTSRAITAVWERCNAKARHLYRGELQSNGMS